MLGKRDCYFTAVSLVLAMALALFAVGCSKKEDASEQQARLALEELLTCTTQQVEEFDAAMLRMAEEAMETVDGEPGMSQGGTALLDHFTGRFGERMTGECIQQLMANRSVALCIDLSRKHQADIKPEGLEISKREGEKPVYDYTATFNTNTGEVGSATGSITMEETEAGWMAANITLTVKEPYGR